MRNRPLESVATQNTAVSRTIMSSLLSITAATGLMGVAIILWLHLAERFGL